MIEYKITKHAVERAIERLEVTAEMPRPSVTSHIKMLMQTAVLQGELPGGKLVYDHYRTRTRIVVAKETNTVLTIYPMDTDKDGNPVERVPVITELHEDNIVFKAAKDAARRELEKARRTFTRDSRSLQTKIAELGVEIAQSTLNKVKCLHPGTKTIIQRNIDEMQAEANALIDKLRSKADKYEELRKQAEVFIGD